MEYNGIKYTVDDIAVGCESEQINDSKNDDRRAKSLSENERTFNRLMIDSNEIIDTKISMMALVDEDIDHAINAVRKFAISKIPNEFMGKNKNYMVEGYLDYYMMCRKQYHRDNKKFDEIMREHKIRKMASEVEKKKIPMHVKVCEHEIVRSLCEKCKSSSVCRHGRSTSNCFICGSKLLCRHFCKKQMCRICNKDKYCVHEWCDNLKNAHDEICLQCKVFLFPHEFELDQKSKERLIASYVLKKFKDFTWILDKQIECGN